MPATLKTFIFASLVLFGVSLYTDDSAVFKLTEKNF